MNPHSDHHIDGCKWLRTIESHPKIEPTTIGIVHGNAVLS